MSSLLPSAEAAQELHTQSAERGFHFRPIDERFISFVKEQDISLFDRLDGYRNDKLLADVTGGECAVDLDFEMRSAILIASASLQISS